MPLDDLTYRHRPASDDADGALILMHGRGVDENDLFPLIDLLDPQQRLEAFTPRAPLQPAGQMGNHWYVVQQVGYPDHESFTHGYGVLGSWLDAVAEETGIPPGRTVLGGFSQGGVVSYATGLGEGRPVPAGVIALSSFIPRVEGWEPDFSGREELPVYHGHGTADPIITVDFGRQARDLLDGRVNLTYREHPGAHTIDPRSFGELPDWITAAVDRAGA